MRTFKRPLYRAPRIADAGKLRDGRVRRRRRTGRRLNGHRRSRRGRRGPHGPRRWAPRGRWQFHPGRFGDLRLEFLSLRQGPGLNDEPLGSFTLKGF